MHLLNAQNAENSQGRITTVAIQYSIFTILHFHLENIIQEDRGWDQGWVWGREVNAIEVSESSAVKYSTYFTH